VNGGTFLLRTIFLRRLEARDLSVAPKVVCGRSGFVAPSDKSVKKGMSIRPTAWSNLQTGDCRKAQFGRLMQNDLTLPLELYNPHLISCTQAQAWARRY